MQIDFANYHRFTEFQIGQPFSFYRKENQLSEGSPR